MFPRTNTGKEPSKEEILAELRRRKLQRKLLDYRPYPKQYDFHAMGATFRERLFMAGNQEGKTFGASHEVAFHATGLYPKWWPGRKFSKPVTIWTGAPTNEKSKGVVQKQLLGTTVASLKHPDMGTGTLPMDSIVKVTTRQAGVKDVVDEILVRHISGGISRIALLTYEMGAAKWGGEPVDVVWEDEEPSDYDIYSEGLTRTNATGGIVLLTFTPLLGLSKTVRRFLQPEKGSDPRSVTNMTILDCVGGVWPEGTPWSGQPWEGHYTRDQADRIIASYEPWERDTRAFGVPMMGEGMVFPVAVSEITVDPFQIPNHWARISGCDFGMDHPAAGVCLAHDRDTDCVYVTRTYRKSGETPVYHAAALKAFGEWVPIAWPHDGEKRDPGSGVELHKLYRKHGANLLPISARYDNQKGGRQPINPILEDMLERMRTGRFKVFSNLSDWFEEFRMYHRKDGIVVDTGDDIMSATRYAMMMLRYAMTDAPRKKRSSYARPIVSAWG